MEKLQLFFLNSLRISFASVLMLLPDFPAFSHLSTTQPSNPGSQLRVIATIKSSDSLQVSPVITIMSFFLPRIQFRIILAFHCVCLLSFDLEKQLLRLSLTFVTLTLS